MRLLKCVALLGALALAGPGVAQLRPSPLGDIFQSYNDCFKVATKDGMKPEALGSLGWTRATISNGKSDDKELVIYGHSTRNPIILLSAEQGEGLCVVMARLETAQAFEEFKGGWGGKLPNPDQEGVIFFFAEGHPVRLQQTGSPQEPGMTISVMTPTKSN